MLTVMFRILVLLAISVVLCACAVPLPISVRDGQTIGHDMQELPVEVEQACDMLEIECVATDWDYGAVQLDLIIVDADAERDHMGHAQVVKGRTEDAPCTPRSWADPTKIRYIAHELGHIFELEHSHEIGNVMNGDGHGGSDFTDEQLDSIRPEANHLVNCR